MAIGAVKAIEGGTAMANFAGGMAKGYAKGAVFNAVMGDASELGAAHAAERSGGAAGKAAAKPVQSAQGSTETDSHSNVSSGTPKQNGYAINEHALRDAVHSGNTAVLRSVSSLLNDEGLRDILGHKTFNMFRNELDGAFGRAFGLSDLANSIVPPGFFSAGATVSALVRASSQGVTRAATSVTKGGAESAKQAANLKDHLRQAEKYGKGGVKDLQNGRTRYYGETVPASKAGEMAGRRTVREWDPATGNKRTWHETVDHNGNVRQVRPEFNDGTKTHYTFDKSGNFTGSW